MRPDSYIESAFGKPTREPGNKWSFWYYSPKTIPRHISLPASSVKRLADAEAALGRLHGLGYLIQDPEVLIGPYLRREALASSRIEGTQASLSEVMKAEVVDEDSIQTDDVMEVHRYLQASRRAFRLVEDLPITQRLILEVHEVLMSGVRGEEKDPGHFRRSPVWVGPPGATPETATYVPPLPGLLPSLLADWEEYVNQKSPEAPVLIQCAMMHYQFETIHPFLDGNGRIGRLLILLLLKERGRLDFPLLYLSNYFEIKRNEYYAALQSAREDGDILVWIDLFLDAVRVQSDDAVWRARKLVDVRDRYMKEAIHTRSKLPMLAEMLIRNPFVTTKVVARKTGLSTQGARNLLRKAETLGWIESVGTFGRGGREHWYSQEILVILESPMRYETSDS
ncbi:MAG: Fic/DOC family N-terminal domain-containing protein [Ornithinimicrobium sp.]